MRKPATAMRVVAMESAKCRSGRACDRTSVGRVVGVMTRGGKTSHLLCGVVTISASDAMAAYLLPPIIAESTAGFYASVAWVAAHGHPRTADHAVVHDFIGSDRTGRLLDYLRAHGVPLSERNIRTQSDNSVTTWEIVRHGLGIGIMMDDVARLTPRVDRSCRPRRPTRRPRPSPRSPESRQRRRRRWRQGSRRSARAAR
jgi:DNA-binding transcriptional LysR family regulator